MSCITESKIRSRTEKGKVFELNLNQSKRTGLEMLIRAKLRKCESVSINENSAEASKEMESLYKLFMEVPAKCLMLLNDFHPLISDELIEKLDRDVQRRYYEWIQSPVRKSAREVLSVVSNKSPMFRGCCTTVVAQHYCNKLLRNTMFPKQNKNQNIVKMAHVNTRFILLCQLKLLISILARRRKQKQKKRRSHRFWVRDIFKNRVEKVAFYSLIPEL